MMLHGLRERLAAWADGESHRPRLARRAIVHCPHTGEPVEIDLELDFTGRPCRVLRCSAHAVRPPPCDQACRAAAEAVIGPARALLILPPGHGLPDDMD